MRISIILSIALSLIMGCGKSQTLAQREATNFKPKSEILDKYPSFAVMKGIVNSADFDNPTVVSQRNNYNSVILPVGGVLTGVTSLSGIAELAGWGMLSSGLSWMSSENQLIRFKIKDLDSFYRPDITFVKKDNISYLNAFDQALTLMNEQMKSLSNCKLHRAHDDGNFAYAYTYHLNGEYKLRTYSCSSEDLLHVFDVYSEAKGVNSFSLMRVKRILQGESAKDMNLAAEEYKFKHYHSLNSKIPGWGVFYSGHEKELGWEWKNYYRNKDGEVFTFEAPKFADDKMNETRRLQIAKRKSFFENGFIDEALVSN